MTTALPDPYTNAEMYADVPTKRLIAWGVDFLVIAGITVVLVPITLFTALFYLPFLWLMASFLYHAAMREERMPRLPEPVPTSITNESD